MKETEEPSSTAIMIRGVRIEEDSNGHWNLNDIWALAKSPTSRAPKHWRGNKGVKRLIEALQKKVTSGYLKEKKPIISVIYSSRGRGSEGTYAHPILAASYAGYLNEKLEIETREVWLRYRSSDATLADEILQRATPEANEWAGVRALGRSVRNEFTDTLQVHGVEGGGYARITNAVYESLFGKKKRDLAYARGLPMNANLRDSMEKDELVSVMFAEMLSKQNINAANSNGNIECEAATRRSSTRVRATIEENQKDRQRRATR
ncbi:KilA-N domain-containing protein [Pseudaminobacter sp. 19-2017]|uniref:KilA-N domain-containing protein n=1 Tax=Pseudaminobacter soli (ex Zhang et al. 2022) TaxID=2831468 RepID=A0A942E318_9HYPH|nr:KilA-N domain-containing protein [Pseudaminobacter soli]MBS3649680.1 KilA-N domain-containing protein [Pseudaminobacter soli]